MGPSIQPVSLRTRQIQSPLACYRCITVLASFYKMGRHSKTGQKTI